MKNAALEEPELPTDPFGWLVLNAWAALTTMRPPGWGATCIPWDKVMYYAQAKGYDDEAAERLWGVVNEADALFLRHLADTKPPPAATPPAVTPPEPAQIKQPRG